MRRKGGVIDVELLPINKALTTAHFPLSFEIKSLFEEVFELLLATALFWILRIIELIVGVMMGPPGIRKI